jgi:rod shape determining protein RodA
MRNEKGLFRNVDRGLLIIYLLMVSMGVANIYSSAFNPEHPFLLDQSMEYGKQALWFGISIFLGGIILLLEGTFIRKFAYEFYGAMLVLLIAVLVVGVEKNGAKAWFGVGSFGIQPSEFAKIGVALALAKFLSTPQIRLDDTGTRLYTVLFIGAPALLILLQPDVGTIIVFVSFILMLYREGMSGNLLLYGLLAIVLAVLSLKLKETTMELPIFGQEVNGTIGLIIVLSVMAILVFFLIRQMVNKRNRRLAITLLFVVFIGSVGVVYGVKWAFYNVFQEHQRTRIDLTLGNIEDPDGKDYNSNRAKAAIGSGGFFGKGFMGSTLANSSQKHVPMQSTDFIYCTLSEEWGFLGSVTIILLFMLLLFRLTIIAERQRSTFTRIFTYCVSSIIFFHFLINVGMAIGLAPVIGIPLPFFSYGGSSLMAFSMLIFLVLKLDSERLDVLR